MKKFFLLVSLASLFLQAQAQTNKDISAMKTPFEKNDNYTPTYHEIIDYYKALASTSAIITMNEFGMTDSGFPLHEIIISSEPCIDGVEAKKNNKTVYFINNGIHPGEPCGIDASMLFVRDLVSSNRLSDLLKDVVIVVVPVYNIGGCLNRTSTSRANQLGPEAYGFRGNAKNLDLNRDFIKCDSENALSFNQLFSKWDPDIFVDTHTSNGADYQYTMTLIPTQKDKLEKPLSDYLTEQLLPDLYKKMDTKGYEMTPYVYARETPDDGIMGFLDLPRYSSGYAALHNTLSFMPETHMLKPYKDRVISTYLFLESVLEHLFTNKEALHSAREKSKENTRNIRTVGINWELERDVIDTLKFKGYEAKYKPSEVSGLDRLYYDRNEPFEKEIKHFNTYKVFKEVQKPKAYIIPQAYRKVIQRLEANNVKIDRFENDSILTVTAYIIKDFETTNSPYEGHYLHSNTVVEEKEIQIKVFAGDHIVYTGQDMDQYIVHTLEPQSPDSYFAWNFMDGILMQKEHFSPYVFEDTAAKLLKENPDLKKSLEEKKQNDSDFAQNGYLQLLFIYQNSPYYEGTHMRYPIFKYSE